VQSKVTEAGGPPRGNGGWTTDNSKMEISINEENMDWSTVGSNKKKNTGDYEEAILKKNSIQTGD